MFGFTPIGAASLGEGPPAAAVFPAISSTEIIQIPVNCVLAGAQPVEAKGREWDIHPPNYRSKTVANRSGARRLSGAAPSFTSTTNRRGYD